ncbi:hypothetical protein CTA2_360 [Colletotrichum tanaceti]|nr:hypothetical protein CTA2_360 [Colletotrichum tanaceti]
MPSLFSRLKTKDGSKKSNKGSNSDAADQLSAKPKWDDAYTRKTVEPEEIQDLIRRCTGELKARGGLVGQTSSTTPNTAPCLRAIYYAYGD